MAMPACVSCHDLSISVHVTNTSNHKEEEDGGYRETWKRYEDIKSTLVKERGWMSQHLVKYQGFWLTPNSALKAVLLFQAHYKARQNDIFLASSPKTGTTWLKSLIFATINRSLYGFSTHPLLSTAPHDLFPILDLSIHQQDFIYHLQLQDHDLSHPCLFSTHIPYTLLPRSMITSWGHIPKAVGEVTDASCNKHEVIGSDPHANIIVDQKETSGCKIIYICRDPKDVLVSKWVFMNKLRPQNLEPLTLQEAFELFCKGVSHYGPYWDHVLGYWQMSLKFPNKVLFLKYEDMKREPLVWLKLLAEFLGQPFSQEEEDGGLAEKIVKLCSFESLSNLEVNRTTVQHFNEELNVENCHFFRRGLVGDWRNHLTPEMVETLDRITYKKFHAFGLKLGTPDRSLAMSQIQILHS